jgi:hypothetical protein
VARLCTTRARFKQQRACEPKRTDGARCLSALSHDSREDWLTSARPRAPDAPRAARSQTGAQNTTCRREGRPGSDVRRHAAFASRSRWPCCRSLSRSSADVLYGSPQPSSAMNSMRFKIPQEKSEEIADTSMIRHVRITRTSDERRDFRAQFHPGDTPADSRAKRAETGARTDSTRLGQRRRVASDSPVRGTGDDTLSRDERAQGASGSRDRVLHGLV